MHSIVACLAPFALLRKAALPIKRSHVLHPVHQPRSAVFANHEPRATSHEPRYTNRMSRMTAPRLVLALPLFLVFLGACSTSAQQAKPQGAADVVATVGAVAITLG